MNHEIAARDRRSRRRAAAFQRAAPIALLALASCTSMSSSNVTSVLTQLLGLAILAWVILLIV